MRIAIDTLAFFLSSIFLAVFIFLPYMYIYGKHEPFDLCEELEMGVKTQTIVNPKFNSVTIVCIREFEAVDIHYKNLLLE